MTKRFCFFLCVLTSFLLAQNPVRIETFDEQGNNPGQLTLRLRLTNLAGDTLRNLRIRYFLPLEIGRSLQLSPYYLAGSSLSVDTVGGFLAVNVDILKLVPGVFPNESGISLGMHYADYGDFEKADHFSYPGADSFAETDRIPVYLDGTLLVGEAPFDDGMPKIRISGFQPEKSRNGQWVQLKNVGDGAVDLRFLSLSDSSGAAFPLADSDAVLSSGESLLVCVSSPCAGGLDLPGLSLGSAGELTLKYGSLPMDYVAWGGTGVYAAQAVAENLWPGADDFLQIGKAWGPALPYEAGSLFRRIRDDEFAPSAWLLFSSDEIGVSEGKLPHSAPFSWNDGVQVVLDSGESMHFAWMPVPGAASYRLSVYAGDSTLVHREVTSKLSADVELPDGKYLWGVESTADGSDWGAAEFNLSRLFSVERLSAVTYVDGKSLDVEPIAARKDTRLVVPNWGMYADLRGWDSSHVGRSHWDEEESWRCWAVAIQELNRYFGGDLTQDEIKIYGMNARGNTDWILGVFPFERKGSGGDEVVLKTLAWAFNNAFVEYHDSIPSVAFVQESINGGKPVIAGTVSHLMVVDAYRVRSDGRLEAHFLNPHNDGGSEWRVFASSGILSYFSYEVPLQSLNTDSLVHRDSDGDGLVDFDEIYRFKTDPERIDSDGDGIPDKTEIWSYTVREVVNWKSACEDSSQNPLNMQGDAWILGVDREWFADVDGDGLRAELDVDSDNDGLKDGEEDLNANGIVDDGETDPYVAEAGNTPVYAENDVPGDFALYSLGKLSLNDGCICFDYKKYPSKTNVPCSFASESDADYYAVSLAGGSQHILHSKGGVLLRNRDTLNAVNIYSNKDKKPVLNVQKGAMAAGHAYVLEQNWLWSVNTELDSVDVGNRQKTVQAGETFSLLDGAKYQTLKVESGGTLLVGTGEMFVGNLQLEAGSKIDFIQRGYKTVLHTKNQVVWRGAVDIEGLRPTGVTYRMWAIAQGFKLVHHGNEPLFIEGDWAGTIFAPKAKLVLGQAKKEIYGRFVGNGITVHQYASLYAVPFAPEMETTVAYFNMEEK
ncbi:hypothetical protein [Fibrobacter intestinalis]|uniref:hypothetical protein n=1 Tax=Fibrobacter intestinalis TaxID=28122 RepID=UPI0023F22F8C|nr:hypothetical protein [Fibrobacter intestinalis]MDD7299717.1 hypothetical protein [Fibrobacter intestinalis]